MRGDALTEAAGNSTMQALGFTASEEVLARFPPALPSLSQLAAFSSDRRSSGEGEERDEADLLDDDMVLVTLDLQLFDEVGWTPLCTLPDISFLRL